MSVKTEVARRLSVNSIPGSVDYVGFSNFPNQVFRRCIKNGFEFTLMVVGQSGLGKSTFLNTLFLTEICDRKQPAPLDIPSTVKIESKTVKLTENDVRLTITFVDTPGFGDLVDNSKCWDPIVKFIDSKYSEYLNEETKVDRQPTIKDNRVHLCLYFIAPTGHRLKALDIEFMRALQDRVNIVPVIAKADTFRPDELAKFKKNILEDLARYNLKLYEFAETEFDANDKSLGKLNASGGTQQQLAEYRRRIPFAVVSSNQMKETERNHRVRVREYPWGSVEVESLAHNDFVALRDMIIKNNLIELIHITKTVHYENFRIRQMCSSSSKNTLDNDPFTQIEQDRKTSEARAAQARNAKEEIFNEKVEAKEKKLRERETTLDADEHEYNRTLEQKRAEIEKLTAELMEMRQGSRHNFTDSGSSLCSEKGTKKKLGLFNRH